MAAFCCRISAGRVVLCCGSRVDVAAESRVDHMEICSIRDFAKRRIEQIST